MLPNRPIVYLRPFSVDDLRISNTSFLSKRKLTFRNYEQLLKRSVGRIGPFVTVGKPGDKVPQLGAARMYLKDEHWHQTVTKLILKAQLLLLHLSDSEGFLWELGQVVQHLDPVKVILCLPLNRRGDKPDKAKYEMYKRACLSSFPRPLPENVGDAQFIYFSENWIPRLLEPNRSRLHLNLPDIDDDEAKNVLTSALESLNSRFTLASTPLIFRHPSFYGLVILIVFFLSLGFC